MNHGHHDWDDHAERYDRIVDHFEPEMSKATQALLDAVDVRPGTRLLDLACGPGHTTAAAKARGACALGIDRSPKMIAAARRRFPDAHFQVADILEPPPGPWDAAVCRLGVHHVDERWATAIGQALRPGGRVAVAELDAHDQQARDSGMRPPEHWAHVLESAGFTDIAVTTRNLRLGNLAARLPPGPTGTASGSHFQNGPIYVVSGRKPETQPPRPPTQDGAARGLGRTPSPDDEK